MRAAIQARLDPETRRKLAELERATGWTTSRLVREGLHLLSATRRRNRKGTIIGLGAFASAVPDLATNKKHLKDFGR